MLGPLLRIVSLARVSKSAARHLLQVWNGEFLLYAGRKESCVKSMEPPQRPHRQFAFFVAFSNGHLLSSSSDLAPRPVPSCLSRQEQFHKVFLAPRIRREGNKTLPAALARTNGITPLEREMLDAPPLSLSLALSPIELFFPFFEGNNSESPPPPPPPTTTKTHPLRPPLRPPPPPSPLSPLPSHKKNAITQRPRSR